MLCSLGEKLGEGTEKNVGKWNIFVYCGKQSRFRKRKTCDSGRGGWVSEILKYDYAA